MKTCYVLESKGEDELTVYRSLKRLMISLGKPRQYQTFRREFKKGSKITLGDVVIRKGILITSTHE